MEKNFLFIAPPDYNQKSKFLDPKFEGCLKTRIIYVGKAMLGGQ